jgi:PAS domain S-box-containing protein
VGLVSGDCNAASQLSEVRVGSELEFSPYAFVDESGRPAGFSVDLIKAVAEAMGLSITISTGPWNNVWNALVAGRLDVLPIVAKLPERQPFVDFSLPHTETYDAFFVCKGNSPIQNIDGARGKEIVVMRSDAAHHELLERNFRGRLIPVDTIPEGLSLISSGKHDAFLCSKLIGTMSIKKHGLTGLTAGPPIPDYKRVFSFAVKKGDTELLEKLNQGLLIIKTSGRYDQIYEKWLTADDPWRKWEKYLGSAIAIVIAIALIVGIWLVMLHLLVKRRTRELAERNELLRSAREGLEERVAERTGDLSRANVALQTEITERKQAEEALRKSEARYRSYIEVTEQLGWTTNANGEVVEDIPSWRTFTGQSEEEVKGWGWSHALHPEDLGHTARVWRDAVAAKSNYEVEYRIRRDDGVYRHFLARGVPVLKEDGNVREWVGTCVDITERKQAEEALRKAHDELEARVQERTSALSEAVQRLRAEIIQRKRLEETLRESETQVRFFASQCLTVQETERKRIAGELHDSIVASLAAVRFRIEKIAENMNRGLSTPESLQDVDSRVNEIAKEVRRIMADLRPSILDDLGIIAAIHWFCREYMKSYSHISVETQIGISEHEVPDSLKTPVFRISQEAMNNVAKYSKASLVNISLQKSDDKIELIVQDNGQGFDLDTVRKGLGLSTMKERAQLSGGSFDLRSVIGKGTIIRVSWPI